MDYLDRLFGVAIKLATNTHTMLGVFLLKEKIGNVLAWSLREDCCKNFCCERFSLIKRTSHRKKFRLRRWTWNSNLNCSAWKFFPLICSDFQKPFARISRIQKRSTTKQKHEQEHEGRQVRFRKTRPKETGDCPIWQEALLEKQLLRF